jgi:acetate kinase
MRVLVLNPGSSSLKSSVIETASIPAIGADGLVAAASAESLAPLGQVEFDWGADATAEGGDPAGDIRSLVARNEAAGISLASLGAVGYRVVQGGATFREPVLVTPRVVEQVAALRELAPLHNGMAAAAMTAGLAAIPHLPHVVVFDTAFHATLPEEAFRYPVPERWYREWGVRRYGFHGISVAWAAERAASLLARPVGELRTVVAHLGSGCSVTAVDGGRSVATSMGLTPLEGLMMGTRAGSIDPGAMFYLLRSGRLSSEDLAEQMDHESGLLGVSGQTSDVRELVRLEAAGDERATIALAMFTRRAAECIAASVTALPTLDAIVFTGGIGGIGENAAGLRARIVARLGFHRRHAGSRRSAQAGRDPVTSGKLPGGTPDRGAGRPRSGLRGGPARRDDRTRLAPPCSPGGCGSTTPRPAAQRRG